MARIEVVEQKCKGCGLCIAACPKDCLEMSIKLNERGVNYPVMKKDAKCTGCASCALICPDARITVYREKKKKKEAVEA
jgi:2-oxoglutarate ferredoxin oxidoreductase subunit delta